MKTNKKIIERVSQGDVIKDVEYSEKLEESKIFSIKFSFAIVLTQDCDLEQDSAGRNSKKEKNDDKRLISVIVAPAYKANDVFAGTHLNYINMKMSLINEKKSPGKNLKNNEKARYHYLNFESNSMSDLIIDFKHYFTVNVRYLTLHKSKNFICQINELYREDISRRFTNYLSRIALPN